MKLENGKKKLNETTYNIKQINICMIFNNLKQLDLLVIVFILEKLVRIKQR